jgi:REP element-mobilizing transposase RayT
LLCKTDDPHARRFKLVLLQTVQSHQLRKKPYWGNHFWAKGYCLDTVGMDAHMIRKYVEYQEKRDKQEEPLTINV